MLLESLHRGDVGPFNLQDLWTIALISKTKNNIKSGFELNYFVLEHGNIEWIKNGKMKQVKAAA